MRKFILVLIMIFMFVIPNTDAFQVSFVNDTDKTMIYHITWLTCDWESCYETGGIAYMGAGELKPGKSTILGEPPYEYKAGIWKIDWDYLYTERVDNPDILPEIIKTHQFGILKSTPGSLVFHPAI